MLELATTSGRAPCTVDDQPRSEQRHSLVHAGHAIPARTGSYQGSTGCFFVVRGGAGGAPSSSSATQRRVSAGSIDVVDLEVGGDVDGLADLVHLRQQLLVARFTRLGIVDGFEVAPVAQAHRTLEAHAAELTRRPRDDERVGGEAPGRHRERAEAVALAQHHGREGHGDVGAGHEHAVAVPHLRGALRVRPHHESGRVAQAQDGKVERVAQLQEARRLVGGITVDRAAEVRGIVGEHAERPSLDPHQRGDDPRAELAAQLQHRVGVGQQLDERTHVVHLHPVLGDRVPEPPLVRALPAVDRAPEVGEVLLRDADRFRFVGDTDVDDTGRGRHVDRTDLLRFDAAEATAFDHRGARHAEVRVLGRDDGVAAPEQGRVPRERRARRRSPPAGRARTARRTTGTPCPRIRRRSSRRRGARRRRRRTGPAAAAAPRRAGTTGPSCGGCSHPACRRRPCSRTTTITQRMPSTVATPPTRPSAGERAMSSSRVDRLDCAARVNAPYSTNEPGSHRSSMFSRAVRRPRACCAATAGVRSGVAPDVVACHDLGEVGPDRLEVDGDLGGSRGPRDVGGLDFEQDVTLVDGVAGRDLDHPHDAVVRSGDDVLHLHRLEHDERRARAHERADRHVHDDDRALHRRGDRAHAREPTRLGVRGPVLQA